MALRNPAQHKFLEHIRSQMFYTTFAALALFDAQHHALGIDIGDLQKGNLGDSQPRAIADTQRRLVFDARCRLQKTRHLIRA